VKSGLKIEDKVQKHFNGIIKKYAVLSQKEDIS